MHVCQLILHIYLPLNILILSYIDYIYICLHKQYLFRMNTLTDKYVS